MSENIKKIKPATVLITTCIFLVIIVTPVIKTLIPDINFIITERDGKMYRAKKFFACGVTIVFMKSADGESDKIRTLETVNSDYKLCIISIKDLKNIEIIGEETIIEEIIEKVEARFLGKYRIQVQGHTGSLRLWIKDNRVSGTVQFPQWGKGATEYLKGVKISNGGISFTRSASSIKEINRLGANSYFTQKFSGRYSNSGKKINGFFINDRQEKHQWEADK